jgi:carnitine monooxygenase subunit
LADELESWGIGKWSLLSEKVLDTPIERKLAIDTFAENYHFATVHKITFATIARSNCTVFDVFGPPHRLVFPLNGIVLSATVANGEPFRMYPPEGPGHPSPCTRTRHR